MDLSTVAVTEGHYKLLWYPVFILLELKPRTKPRNTSDWHLPARSLSCVFPSVICLICPGLKQNKHIMEIIHSESKQSSWVSWTSCILGSRILSSPGEHLMVFETPFEGQDNLHRLGYQGELHPSSTSIQITNKIPCGTSHPTGICVCAPDLGSSCPWISTSYQPAACCQLQVRLQLTFHCYHRQMKQDNNMKLWLGRHPWNISCFLCFWSQILGVILTWIPFKHSTFPPKTKHQVPQWILVNQWSSFICMQCHLELLPRH